MESHLFWFNDEQWARIEPHWPTNQPGPRRKDDRLILSGIMQVLKVGLPPGRLPDCVRPPQDDLQSLCPLERAGNLAEGIRGGRRSFRAAGTSRAV
jgi:transposase